MGQCNDLGTQHANGIGLPRAIDQAMALYRRACEGGDGGGCFNVGANYDEGGDMPPDAAQAVTFYQRACDLGGDGFKGCANLGAMYADGRGVGRNSERAVSLYALACGARVNEACFSLGGALEAGTGVPRNLERAAELYRQTCDAGVSAGCSGLAVLTDAGRGVARDRAAAAALRLRACGLGGHDDCATGRERQWRGRLSGETLPARLRTGAACMISVAPFLGWEGHCRVGVLCGRVALYGPHAWSVCTGGDAGALHVADDEPRGRDGDGTVNFSTASGPAHLTDIASGPNGAFDALIETSRR
ncbi:MAG: tetratricopeptide repeat protein [Deltaproteobacteria bacterium]